MKKEPSLIDQEITRLTRELKNNTIGSDEYITLLDMISKLNDLKKTDRISKDKWLIAGTNLLGIVLVINHERIHVISQSALRLVPGTKT